MKTKQVLSLAILVITSSLLSSCTMSTMADWLETSRVDTEYIHNNALEFTTLNPHEVDVIDTISTKQKRNIPAGTKLRILASFINGSLYSNSLPLTYVVELPDSSRYLCYIPEIMTEHRAFVKETKDSITIEKVAEGKGASIIYYGRDSTNNLKEYTGAELKIKRNHHFPMTNFTSTRYLSKAYLEEKLLGKSFEEVETFLKPAQNISFKGNAKIARYNHIGTTDKRNNTFYKQTTILFEGGKATKIIGDTRVTPLARHIPGFLTISKCQPLLINAGYDYYIIPRIKFIHLQYLGWTGRQVVSGILLILFLGFMAFLPALISRWTIYYIKFLPNGLIKLIGWVLCIIIYLFITATLCYGEDWLVVVIQTAFFTGIMLCSFSISNVFVETYRCPNCHSVRALISRKDSNKRSETFQSKVNTRDEYSHSETSGSTRTDYYNRKKFRIHTKIVSWNENYTCRKCGYDFHYRKSTKTSAERDI